MKIIKNALVSAVLAVLYIGLVATVMTNIEKLFGEGDPKTVLVPMSFLILFVFSAALMGIIILGKPILWYLDGFKKEAVKLVFYTLGFLFMFLVVAFLVLVLFF
ncbi:MAG: hypothetical protein WC705_01775 [Candidatus Paceibacterota bacterium]|jgi:hypothetical protein